MLQAFRLYAINPRGISGSKGNLEGLTLHDLTNDVAMVIKALVSKPVPVLGNAFGNRVARCLAADHPNLVKSLILIAAGGLHPPDSEVEKVFALMLNPRWSNGSFRSSIGP